MSTDEKTTMMASDGSGSALTDPEKSAASLTELMHAGMGIPSPFMKEIFLLKQAIVGTRYMGGSDDLVKDLKPGSRIFFVAEPDNQYDEYAVMALDDKGRKLGYIPRHENRIIGALLKAGKSIYGIMPDEQPEAGGVAPGSERTLVGHLPIVSHDITEEILPQLEEAYGVELGMPFSNHVVDTRQMAANHLPRIRNASLDKLAEELGIEVCCETREETRCRMIWKLYCRMDRSEI